MYIALGQGLTTPWGQNLYVKRNIMSLWPFLASFVCLFICLCWGLTSQSTIFQSCRDGATASWVINQYFRGVKCLAQGHNTAAVGIEPPTSRSGVRHSTTEPPHSPLASLIKNIFEFEVWFYTIFFMILYMYTAPGKGQTAPGDKVLMSTETSCHFIHFCKFKKKCLWSLILYNFFFMI